MRFPVTQAQLAGPFCSSVRAFDAFFTQTHLHLLHYELHIYHRATTFLSNHFALFSTTLNPFHTATMTGIVQSLENIVSSFFSLIGDVLNGILSAFQSVVAVIFTFFQQLAGLAQDAVSFLLRKLPVFSFTYDVFAHCFFQTTSSSSASSLRRHSSGWQRSNRSAAGR